MMQYVDLGLIFGGVIGLSLIHNIIPKKIKPIFLLLINFSFFFVMSKGLIIYLLLSILSIYCVTNLFDKLNNKRDKLIEEKPDNKKEIKKNYKKRKKVVLLFGIAFNVAFLFYFKYLNFFGTNANYLFDLFNLKMHYTATKIIAPIGISFYTLEALSYILDVYFEKIKADKNIIRVALYLSFFPQIMEGPIARYSDTAESLYNGKKVSYKEFCFGIQRIVFGIFKLAIVSIRLNEFVNKVFNNYDRYDGSTIALGVIGYTVMLYMDFSGTIDVFLGVGELYGVKIPENFRQPFFSKNIREFWMRWHISLGLWFKDYIFYPISLSKPMKKLTLNARKKLGNYYGPMISGAIALFAVWSLNGLWHGAGWPFLFYGMYQFTLILMGNIFEPLIIKLCSLLHINRKNIVYRVFQSVKMTIFVFIGELFFRAPTVSKGFEMLGRIFTKFNISKINEAFNLGIDKPDLLIVLVALIVVFIIGLINEKNKDVREEICKKNIFIRWAIYYAFILAIIVFGVYGTGGGTIEPMYADF